jgi:hypothetical protein
MTVRAGDCPAQVSQQLGETTGTRGHANIAYDKRCSWLRYRTRLAASASRVDLPLPAGPVTTNGSPALLVPAR